MGDTIYSIFNPKFISRVLAENYDGLAGNRAELLSRSWTDVYRVFVNGTVKTARIWRANFHAGEQITFECAFLRYLAANGFGVQEPIATRTGALTLHLKAPEGERPLALFPWIEGDKIGAKINDADCREMGRTLAELHGLGLRSPLPPPKTEPSWDRTRRMLPDVTEVLQSRTKDVQAMLDGMRRAADAVEKAERSGLPHGIVHGDFHAHNVIRTAKGLVLLDFDDVGPGALIRDIAAFDWVVDLLNEPRSHFESFLAGYESLRPLSAAEKAALPIFIADRMCWNILGWTTSLNQLGDPGNMLGGSLARSLAAFEALPK